ncbi:MAG TPA: hypothetical protein VK539_23460 [Myxococcaceae bacterium]|nr:hypothetical protein [Myxococcaceae bacterium]
MPDDTQAAYSVLKKQLLHECESMVEFIATSGGQVPQEAMQAFETAQDLKGIVAVHGQLTKLVAPATPKGIVLMREFKRPGLNLLGPIPIVRGMMLFALLCLTTYISINLQGDNIGVKEEAVGQSQGSAATKPATSAEEEGAQAGRVAGEKAGEEAGRSAGAENDNEEAGEEAGRVAGTRAGEEAGRLAGQEAGAALDATATDKERLEEGRKKGEEAGATAGKDAGEKAAKKLKWYSLTEFALIELMLLALAGLGASFASLFEINKHIVQRNFDPGSQISYWLKCFLGLMAGFILATLIPFSKTASDFGQPLLALLGGFSGSAVHSMLVRLVESLESLVKGSSQEMVEAHERAMKARSAEELLQQRMKLASSVIQLRQKLADSKDQQAVNSLLDTLMGALVSPGDSMKVQAMSVDTTTANLQAAVNSVAEPKETAPQQAATSGSGNASGAPPDKDQGVGR